MLHIKTLKPLNTQVLITGEKYKEDMRDGAITTAVKGDLKTYQKVLAVGPMVRDIKPGDQVMFDPTPYAVMKYDKNSLKNDMDMNKVLRWNLPWVTVDDENGEPQDCLLIDFRYVKFAFEGEEISNPIIMPEKKEIILN